MEYIEVTICTCHNAEKGWLDNSSIKAKEVGMVHQSHNLQLKKDELGNKQDSMNCIPYTLHMEEDRPCGY